ncbi:MAG: hypothetical protein C4334_11945 [Pyrinomonas sp.]|uniref:2Fe-2S iron-sulfur cluster-binding protein n=1 Tax=Pyrinomonas sp. TaxID=2080306 RepID=UPI00332D7DFB
MSVYLRYEPEGLSGVVPEGTYLWEATKRLGARLRAECGGRGQCDACAVIVEMGAELLSPPTVAESELLKAERLAAGQRLACQTRIERGGELVIREVAVERAEQTEEPEEAEQLRKKFLQLPLEKKLAMLLELEAITAYQTLNALSRLPSKAGEKILDLVAARGRELDEQKRRARRPAEHRRGEEGS